MKGVADLRRKGGCEERSRFEERRLDLRRHWEVAARKPILIIARI